MTDRRFCTPHLLAVDEELAKSACAVSVGRYWQAGSIDLHHSSRRFRSASSNKRRSWRILTRARAI
jgi:hypothetical protein